MRSRTLPSHRGWIHCAAVLLAAMAALPAAAADPTPPPAVVASFTQRVQPLLLNRCAAGGCHGGPESPAPRLHRGLPGGPPDGRHTRANLVAFLDVIGPDRDPRGLATLLAAGHPKARVPPALRAAPLSVAERVTIDRWLATVREAEGPVMAWTPEPVPEHPNRFRAMLEAAANPPALPPPQEPQGVIFKNDAPAAE